MFKQDNQCKGVLMSCLSIRALCLAVWLPILESVRRE